VAIPQRRRVSGTISLVLSVFVGCSSNTPPSTTDGGPGTTAAPPPVPLVADVPARVGDWEVKIYNSCEQTPAGKHVAMTISNRSGGRRMWSADMVEAYQEAGSVWKGSRYRAYQGIGQGGELMPDGGATLIYNFPADGGRDLHVTFLGGTTSGTFICSPR
jgi:hypothetical protein